MNNKLIYWRLRRLVWSVYCYFLRPSLRALAVKNRTDKLDHGYIDAYAHWFGSRRIKALNVLEIGVGGYDEPNDGGNSLRMWRDYFPKAMIYAIDIAEKSPHVEKRIRIFRGSQNDPEFLRKVSVDIGRLDIIIDDGSHVSEHIITSFNTLFPLLTDGGIYVIEDLHTSYWPQYGGEASRKAEATSIALIKRLIDGLHHAWIPGQKAEAVDLMVSSVYVYPGVAFIVKGDNTPVLSFQTQGEVRRAAGF